MNIEQTKLLINMTQDKNIQPVLAFRALYPSLAFSSTVNRRLLLNAQIEALGCGNETPALITALHPMLFIFKTK